MQDPPNQPFCTLEGPVMLRSTLADERNIWITQNDTTNVAMYAHVRTSSTPPDRPNTL